ncbi:Matrix metalloproteinase-18 [Holothuria leucospilota]|uniref:Matrix metalloproteinase-18 n=1 Tax=Holothuria leucospilota TaxID=206669 RepID=A0A9Q1HBA6_HOLLE|nr:Matrix metalloproteinase-18 [Holothuria leucospilota]
MVSLQVFFAVFSWVVVCQTAPVQFINSDAVNWLKTFGYLKKGNSTVELKEYQNALKRLQSVYEIPVTGEVDLQTEIVMLSPRCGNPDEEVTSMLSNGREKDQSKIKKRYVKSSSKWNKNDISYKISQYSSQLPVETQRNIIRLAFMTWEEVTPLTFYESTNQDADTEIGFYIGDHNDGSPFTKGIIAHAFLPDNKAFSGDVHVNEANRIVTDPNGNGYYLLSVMIHEIGHTLGLEHSLDKGAMMYHAYGTRTTLSADDIAGIQALYLQKSNSPSSYDVIYNKNDIIYLVKGERVFRQHVSGGSSEEFHLSQLLPNNLERIDAATVIGENVIFITGDQLWKFEDGLFLAHSYPTSLSSINIPGGQVDTMFAIPSESSLYFFRGNSYYRLGGGELVVDSPRLISEKFGSSVAGSDAAFAHNSDIIFVKGTLCYSYDTVTGSTNGPHDFSIDMDFTKCGSIQLLVSPLLIATSVVLRFVFS